MMTARTVRRVPPLILTSSLPTVVLALSLMGCQSGSTSEGTSGAGGAASGPAPALAGSITIDGSSTVLPVSKVMADGFQKANPGVRVAVQSSGTGGGFKKFCAGETDISAASRPINATESQECQAKRIAFVELPIAFDSLSVVVNPSNRFVECLTVAELKKMWEPTADGNVTRWNQIRSSFPDQPLALFGHGREHGTFDYFTLAVVGVESSSRNDYTKNEDDAVLVDAIAADPNALGYFGYAYYQANRDKLKLVAIDNGHGCVVPSAQTVADNSYQPLSRPVFVYVSTAAAARPEVKAVARFYVDPDNSKYVRDVGYVPLPPATLLAAGRRLDTSVSGSIFGGRGSVLGVTADTFQDEDRIRNALVQ